jgi:hypothetical protein
MSNTFLLDSSTIISISNKKNSILNEVCRSAIERYPLGVIFSKKSPSNLNNINYDEDFCYYYFSFGLEERCLLKRINMCTGYINAKHDFPDYKQYFDDDIKVMKLYNNNQIYSICEPWSPPGIHSYVYTRKTAMTINSSEGSNDTSTSSSYMLGCFDLVDDVALGITSFKRISYNVTTILPLLRVSTPESSSIFSVRAISDDWFRHAFDALPNGIAIIDGTTIIHSNQQWNIIMSNINKSYDNGDNNKSDNNHESNNRDNDNNMVSIINEWFTMMYGFNTSPSSLLTSAAWMSSKKFPHHHHHHDEDDNDHHQYYYDIGTYGIMMQEQRAVQVIVLRPTMNSVVKPAWKAVMTQG